MTLFTKCTNLTMKPPDQSFGWPRNPEFRLRSVDHHYYNRIEKYNPSHQMSLTRPDATSSCDDHPSTNQDGQIVFTRSAAIPQCGHQWRNSDGRINSPGTPG